VAETLDKYIDRYGFDRLLLGGTVEAASELQQLLSKRASDLVVERLSLPVKSSAQQVLEETLRVEQQLEREMEKRIVDELIAGDGHNPTILGLERTVRAACEQRVWRLVYADGVAPQGGQCRNCGMLFARGDGSCDYCGAPVEAVDDLLQRIVELVVQQDGTIEQVKSDAAMRLRQADGIGAFLRF
jgi:hypothetical protein